MMNSVIASPTEVYNEGGGLKTNWLPIGGATLLECVTTADDAKYAQAGCGTTKNLRCTGFGFNGLLPEKAVVHGAELLIRLKRDGEEEIKYLYPTPHAYPRLYWDAAEQGNGILVTTYWPSVFTNWTHGGRYDKWGCSTLSRVIVAKADFSVIVAAKWATGVGSDAQVDQVRMKVYYTPHPLRIDIAADKSPLGVRGHVGQNRCRSLGC